MIWTHSAACISVCILLLQSSIVNAVPLNTNRALVKRSSGLHGKFLHITDIHLDPHYVEGADPSSLCHRHGKKRSKEAGKYGALGSDCDSPVPLVKAAFDFLKDKVQDIDFILYTGDTARHDRDDDLPLSNDDILNGHQTVLKYFKSAYNTKHTPYVPTIGNNDGLDHNDVGKHDKIFTKLETIWKPLELNLTKEFTFGGYFAQDVIQDQLSVININSMYFFKKNDDTSDCDEASSAGAAQLKWLENTLDQYASKNEKHQVYLMGHVPPVDDDGSMLYKKACYSKYISLLGKHSDIIAGHFTGHTNNDNLNAIVKDDGEYKIVHAGKHNKVDSKNAVGLFNAPSIIPVHNPAIRVYDYEIDGDKYPVGTILDWKQYYIDLDKANNDGKVKFETEYTASDLFGLDHFDGEGVAKAMNTIAEDKKTRKLYKKYAKVSS